MYVCIIYLQKYNEQNLIFKTYKKLFFARARVISKN